MSSVAAVIVTFNSERVIGGCLDACLHAGLGEILVVDNASADRTCEEVRRRTGIMLIANKTNHGFAAAANQGIASTEAPFVLLLNPDVELATGIDELAAACGNPAVGGASGMLVDGDDRPQAGFHLRRFPSAATLCFETLGLNRFWRRNPVNLRYRYLDRDPETAGAVEQPAGAFLMIRREVWAAVGGLDESFSPVWFEDVDFCRRIYQAGYTIQYVPSVIARHEGAHTIRNLQYQWRQQYWYASLLKYASKHFTRWENAAVSASVMLGAVLRAVEGLFLERSFQSVAVFGKIIRLAATNRAVRRTGGAVNSPAVFVKDRRGSTVAEKLNT